LFCMGRIIQLLKLQWIFLFLCPFLLSREARSQDTVNYQVSFPNRIHHEAEISLTLKNIRIDSLFFRMSSSSPGRYAPHQFAKNIYGVKARNSEGQEIGLFKTHPDQWLIPEHDGNITLIYTLFADHPDGTYAGIDRDFALLNMPASLMWVENLENTPILLEITIPENSSWKIETQLFPTRKPNRYTAPDLCYLMDSPVVLGDFELDTIAFSYPNDTDPLIRILYDPPVDEVTRMNYTEMIRKIVLEQKAVFGEFPEFDTGSYIFLNNYDPAFENDGMEHRNSTLITSSTRLPGNEKKLIRSVAHEFFHAWNVERLRPESLEPFNFTHPNMSGELWFAEGFTSYYGHLSCRRAGIYSNLDFLDKLSGTLNYIMNVPGRKAGSPVYMSQMAPFIDASVWIDEMNVNNVYISYYDYGMAIGLALDLTLRSLNKGISLDDYMKYLWLKYGRDEVPYTLNDLRDALTEITGNRIFSGDFFNRYILHNNLPDYHKLFALAGFDLITKDSSRAWTGYHQFDFYENRALLLTYPLDGDPLYLAGIEKGDELLSLDSTPLHGRDQMDQILRQHLSGDTLQVEFRHHQKILASSIILQPNPELIIRPNPDISQAQQNFRTAWLSSRVTP